MPGRGRPKGPLPPATLAKLRASTLKHCAPGQSWPGAIIWSSDMDARLLRSRAARMTWQQVADVIGVGRETAKRRFRILCPGVSLASPDRPKSKGRKRANASPLVFVSAAQFRAQNGEGQGLQPLPLNAVCSEVHTLHDQNNVMETTRSADHLARKRGCFTRKSSHV